MANKFTDAAFKAQGLTGTQKLTLWVLCHRTDNDSGKCYPSYARIASDACISRSAAMRAVKVLIDLGLVSKCGTYGYKDSEQTNLFKLNIEKLREMSAPPSEKDLTDSAAQPGELQSATGEEAQRNPASCAGQSEELRSAVGVVAQRNSNSECNSSCISSCISSTNSSTNSGSSVSQADSSLSIQNQENQGQGQNPHPGYPEYNPSPEEGAFLTEQLETHISLWAAEHNVDAEEPDDYSLSYNLMNLIWEGNPASSPNLQIAKEIEEVLRWLPKSKHWDKPKPEGLGQFKNSAEFCKAYPAIRKSYLKYMQAIEAAKG